MKRLSARLFHSRIILKAARRSPARAVQAFDIACPLSSVAGSARLSDVRKHSRPQENDRLVESGSFVGNAKSPCRTSGDSNSVDSDFRRGRSRGERFSYNYKEKHNKNNELAKSGTPGITASNRKVGSDLSTGKVYVEGYDNIDASRHFRNFQSYKNDVLAGEKPPQPNLRVADDAVKWPGVFSKQSGRTNKSGQNIGGEQRKPFLQIVFPVGVFADWWFECFLRSPRLFPDLLSPLRKLHFWLGAYQRVHFDATGNYINLSTASCLSKPLEDLKDAVTSGVFIWDDAEHTYVDSPLRSDTKCSGFLYDADDAFSFQDRIVQELLFLLLDPIFEARFSTRSHALRLGRDVHSALRAAKRSFTGCTWFITGDLSVLQEDRYAIYLMDSVLEVVKDVRIASLLKAGFLGSHPGREKLTKAHHLFVSATQGSCGRLKCLLLNALLDPLDWWMDEKIIKFSGVGCHLHQNPSKIRSVLGRTLWKQPRKLEYVRYGTKFWVGCNGTKNEVDSIQKEILSFLDLKFGKGFQCGLSVSHISSGLSILDHVISQRVTRPIFKQRRASSHKIYEKRAIQIKLSLNACLESCSDYIQRVRMPLRLQQVDEILLTLNYWYRYAENREKVLKYCKLYLCSMHAESIIGARAEDKATDFEEQFKKAALSVKCPGIGDSSPVPDNVFLRIPKHERVLRDYAWLQSRGLSVNVRDSFMDMRIKSPQLSMSHVTWQFLRTEKGMIGVEPEDWMISFNPIREGSSMNEEIEELSESAG
ncbi:hypothetical protein KP509_09G034500 [Ceratopteris richardii]|nr:hypothetical protein KP509_09G034500 [Ceratopteris richardii]